jgi:hypothetical protein
VNPEPYVSFDRGFIYDNGQYITFDIPMARDTQPFDIHESGQIDVRAYFTEAPSLRWFRLQPCR